MLSTYSIGFSERNIKPRTIFFSSFVISISRRGRSLSRNTLVRSRSSFSFSNSGVFFLSRSFFMRSRRASTCPRSLTIRSNSTLEISRIGVQRTAGVCNGVVLKDAQHVDQCIDSRAGSPDTRSLSELPAHRTHVGVLHLGGTSLRGLHCAASRSSRSSGTVAMPMCASRGLELRGRYPLG